MLRQLQIRAPFKGVQVMRCLTYNLKQLQPAALVDVVKQVKEQQKPGVPAETMPIRSLCQINGQTKTNSFPLLNFYMPQMIYDKLQNIRKYSVCQNPLDLQLQIDAGKLNRSNNLPIRYDMGPVDQPKSVALVPVEQAQLEQNMKSVGTPKPQPQPQPKVPEQSGRKVPYYNPLRRRSNVDPARVQYIKDRFKERNLETDNNKPQGKKYVSRTTLHSGRLDKID